MEVESSDLSKNEIIEETKEEFNKLKKSKSLSYLILCSAVEKSMGQVDGLTCSICMDFIVSCRTAVCGHSFC